MVQLVSVESLIRLVGSIGVDEFLKESPGPKSLFGMLRGSVHSVPRM